MVSSNMTDDSVIALNAINRMSIMFTRYWSIIMFIVGLIGHSLNISVFSRPTLCSNPCIRYNINLFIPSIILCKTLSYLFSWIR